MAHGDIDAGSGAQACRHGGRGARAAPRRDSARRRHHDGARRAALQGLHRRRPTSSSPAETLEFHALYEDALHSLKALLNERGEAGLVRRCHGDMHCRQHHRARRGSRSSSTPSSSARRSPPSTCSMISPSCSWTCGRTMSGRAANARAEPLSPPAPRGRRICRDLRLCRCSCRRVPACGRSSPADLAHELALARTR